MTGKEVDRHMGGKSAEPEPGTPGTPDKFSEAQKKLDAIKARRPRYIIEEEGTDITEEEVDKHCRRIAFRFRCEKFLRELSLWPTGIFLCAVGLIWWYIAANQPAPEPPAKPPKTQKQKDISDYKNNDFFYGEKYILYSNKYDVPTEAVRDIIFIYNKYEWPEYKGLDHSIDNLSHQLKISKKTISAIMDDFDNFEQVRTINHDNPSVEGK